MAQCLGRHSELARLDACLTQALAGSSAFVVVSGQPGAGKSTLVNAAQEQLAARGALVLEARCRPGLPSYRPVLEVVRAAVELLSTSAPELSQRGEHVLDMLSGRRDLAHTRALELVVDDDATSASRRRIALFDMTAEVLSAASQIRPTVCVFHDLDQADPATQSLVAYLARVLTSAPLIARSDFRGLLVASAANRRELGDDPRWSEGINFVSLDLGGLDEEGVREYLASDDVVRRVLDATKGMPRLLDALVSYSEAEQLSPLRGLGRSELRVLKLLAVFGRALGPETLRLLTSLPHGALAKTIAALMDRRLVEKVIVDGELRVCFARVGDQQSIYQSMSPAEREELHGDVGRHLRERGGEAELEAAAHNLLLGHAGPQAVDTAIAAAQRLEIAFCHERAVDLLERALDQCDLEPVRQAIAAKLCSLYQLTGQLDLALEQAEKLRLDDPGADAALRVAKLNVLRGDVAAARAVLDELDALAEQKSLCGARVLAARAEAGHLAGASEAAREAANLGLELFEQTLQGSSIDEARVQLQLRNTLGLIELDADNFDAARALFLANLEQASQTGLASEEVRAMVQLGLTGMRCGEYAEAERYYLGARRLAQQVGEHRYLGVCHQHLGVLAERRRDYGRALECYQDAVNVCKKLGHRGYLAWLGLDLGKLYLDLGDVARASAMIALATRLGDREPPLAMRINLETLRGRVAASQCRYGEAEQRLERAQQLASSAGHGERATRALLYRVELLLTRGEHRAAADLLDSSGMPASGLTRLRALLLRGTARRHAGALEAARMDLAAALELGEALEDSEAAWEASFQLSRLARAQGRDAEAARLLSEAARGESHVRASVPADLRELYSETPRRAELAAALDSERADVTALERADRSRRVTGPIDRAEMHAARSAAVRTRFANIVGEHARIRQVLTQVERAGPTDALVLIRGESGTGKELIADAIHRESRRATQPLVKVNCGALVESLLLSELFGHERGAFTGATQRKIGRFELADGGTIFLDEIGDISAKTQVALLRVLQERSFERVGGTQSISVDVRIICATNRDLERMVREGQFREDLYYRLKGVQIELPPLRERIDDVALLAEHFLARIAEERSSIVQRLSDSARALLAQHRWPGNIRELENVLRSVSLFADGELLEVEDFSDYPELRCHGGSGAQAPPAAAAMEAGAASRVNPYDAMRESGLSLREMKKKLECDCIERALSDAEGNITKAADLLGMKRPRLSQLIKEHGLSPR
ncbi:MAG: sigma 54-interacting transcriptional regulator [Myxococcales bacterium]|nr:sigma 54-interacting transcriptional regulator [Myxococcales bacterium]